MRLKGITDEDLINFRLPSMFISTATCSFKCDRECGRDVCQNSELAKEYDVLTDDDYLIRRYLKNPISKAIVFGGLEPFDQFPELVEFIRKLRLIYHCMDPVVIYTGYNREEIGDKVAFLQTAGNIIVKFGRFVPDQEPHRDEVLGVDLASDNQYAERIS